MDLFKSTGLSKAKITRAIFTCLVGFAIQACESPGSPSGADVNSNPYLTNSEISISSSTLQVGASATVTLTLKNDSGITVTDAQPEIYFYYYGGTCQGFFSPVMYHPGGTYTSNFTAVRAGSISTIHAKINSEDVIAVRGLPTVKVPGGLPTSISIISGSGQTAHGLSLLPIPFSVILKDESGSVVQGATVNWSVVTGGATFNPVTSTTSADGVAVTQVTLGSKGGVNSITATPGGTTLNANFSATATTTPFLQTWTFDASSSSSYIFDPARIEFSGNVCRLKQSSQTDQDNTVIGFGGGTFSGLVWDSTNQSVRLGSSGSCDGTVSNCSPLAELSASWTPKWSNVVGYWKFNETSGTTFAGSSGGAPTATLTGTTSTVGVTGQLKNAVRVTTGSAITLPSNPFPSGAADRSVSVWFKTPTPGTNQAIAAYGGNGQANLFEILDYNGALAFHCYGGGCAMTSSPVPITANVWHHALITYAANLASVYYDGGLVGTLGVTLNTLNIGSITGAGYFPTTDVALDELAAWNVSLTATEVKTIFNSQSTSHAGVLASRIFDAGSPSANWTSLAWTANLPFAKPLPDAGSSESITDYSGLANNTLMAGIQGLWHFDDTAPASAPGGKDILDSSGNGKHGTKSSSVTLGSPGMMKLAAASNGQGMNMPVTIGTTMTLSLWATSNNIASNPMLWRTGPNGVGPDLFFAGGIISLNTWDSSNNPYGPIPANASDGKFHHYVTVINGATNTSDLYFDGVKLGSAAYRNPAASSLSISSNIGSYEWNGTFDEAAVWNRALSANEISQLYRRQANRILLQVRNCVAADCSDDAAGANWKGPDGSNKTTFSELNNNTVPNGTGGNVKLGSPNFLFSDFTSPPGFSRYFQYRAILESDDYRSSCNYGAGATFCSPELKATSIGPGHFDSTAPSIVTSTGPNALFLTDFGETLGTSCAGGVAYNIGVGTSAAAASWYYWASSKGSDCSTAGSGAWCPADGTVAQSSTAIQVSANALTFSSKAGAGTVFVKSFLKSTGLANCEFHQLDMSGQN